MCVKPPREPPQPASGIRRNRAWAAFLRPLPRPSGTAAEAGWPACVRQVVGDVLVELPGLGAFSLIFADAEGGKLYGLDLTLDAIERKGLLVLDDMRFQGRNPAIEEGVVRARKQLLADGRFLCAEVNWSSGLLLATKVR